MTQTTEQKILMLVGISLVWIIVLLIIFREIGWYACIPFFVVYAGIAAIASIPLYREWSIIAKGERLEGTLIACGRALPLYNYRTIEAAFSMNGQRYTTTFPVENLAYDNLTGLECTVYCRKIRGKRHCLVRDIQYDRKYCTVGIPLPEKPESELCGRWYLAFSEQELADPMHKKLLRGNGADYRHLYK